MGYRGNLITLFIACVAGLGVVSFLAADGSPAFQGLAPYRGFEKPARVFPRYCHGWEEGSYACFRQGNNRPSDALTGFQCQNYYWVPVKGRVVKCCQSLFDCRQAGSFRMKNYCDAGTNTCKFR